MSKTFEVNNVSRNFLSDLRVKAALWLLSWPCLVLIALTLVAGPAQAATSAQLFQKGWKSFHSLRKDESRAKYRSSWMQVKNIFWELYQRDPSSGYAPKALYYLARVYSEMGKRSYLPKDYRKATDYFQRVVTRFPDHSWSDDAQYRKALINLEHLNNPDQAYLDLLSVVHNYPDGDMTPKARSLLKELDQDQKGQDSLAPDTNDSSEQPEPGYKRLLCIRHWSSDDYTRVVLDVSNETAYDKHLLEPDPKLGTPHRLVLDLQDTHLDERCEQAHKIRDGLLQRVRTGQFRPHTARVVLDIQRLDKYRVFSLQNPFRIVLDVYAPEKGQLESDGQRLASQAPMKKGPASSNLIEHLGLTIQTIMIDPGHGGKDPGAVSGNTYEKDINLKMAQTLGQMLEEAGFKVLYTRTKDVFIPLEERTALANSKKADLFISIHANSHPNSKVHGLELYSLNLAKSKDAVRVAARENAISVKKISDLQVILTDLMLNTKIKASKKLAQKLLTKTLTHSRRFYPIHDHGVREAPFYVLMGAKMPAVLVELGYLSNPVERKRLESAAYRKRLAQGLVQGITAYKKTIDSYAQR